MGDYSFPCFRLAKVLKKSPQIIAEELKEKLIFENDEITKVEVVNGYLNFFINNLQLVKEVLKEIDEKKEKYGSSDMGKGKTLLLIIPLLTLLNLSI